MFFSNPLSFSFVFFYFSFFILHLSFVLYLTFFSHCPLLSSLPLSLSQPPSPPDLFHLLFLRLSYSSFLTLPCPVIHLLRHVLFPIRISFPSFLPFLLPYSFHSYSYPSYPSFLHFLPYLTILPPISFLFSPSSSFFPSFHLLSSSLSFPPPLISLFSLSFLLILLSLLFLSYFLRSPIFLRSFIPPLPSLL